MSDLTTKGRATKIPSIGVNMNQKAHRFQTHQYQTVAMGLINRHRLHKSFWVQVARGVLAAWTKAQIQKPIKMATDTPKRPYQVQTIGSKGSLWSLRSGKFMSRIG